MTNRVDIIDRSLDDKTDVRAIDAGIKNPWRWNWLENKVEDVYYLKDFVRKINKPGVAYCTICCKELLYGSRGFAALKSHTTSSKHKSVLEMKKTNFALPGKSTSRYFCKFINK